MTVEAQISSLESRMTGVERAVEDARDEQRTGTAQILDALRGTLDKPGGYLGRVESLSSDVDELKRTVKGHGESLERSRVLAGVLSAVPEKARTPALVLSALFLGIVPPGWVASRVSVQEEDIAAALVALESRDEEENARLREAKIEAGERIVDAYRDAGEIVGVE